MNYQDIIRILDGHSVPYKVMRVHNRPCEVRAYSWDDDSYTSIRRVSAVPELWEIVDSEGHYTPCTWRAMADFLGDSRHRAV